MNPGGELDLIRPSPPETSPKNLHSDFTRESVYLDDLCARLAHEQADQKPLAARPQGGVPILRLELLASNQQQRPVLLHTRKKAVTMLRISLPHVNTSPPGSSTSTAPRARLLDDFLSLALTGRYLNVSTQVFKRVLIHRGYILFGLSMLA